METFDTRYMYKNSWTEKSQSIFNEEKIHTELPKVVEVNNATLLPQKNGELHWGLGGCLDEEGNFVEESSVIRAFGGKYDYNKDQLELLDETVVFIPIIPKQWGHFIIDVISRLWIFLDDRYKTDSLKIYYCTWGFENGEITGNYGKYLEYLGIKDRMIYLEKPLKVKKVLIPTYTMSFSESCNPAYKKVNEYVVQKVMNSDSIKEFKRHDKVYFSRTNLDTSKFKEIGENHIEDILEKNGFYILRPENMSLEEQIFYYQTSNYIVGMSGTAMHNIIFSNKDSKFFILNRTCMPNEPQLMLNKLYPNEVYIVDTYAERTLKHPRDYGTGPFMLDVNSNFKKFLHEEFGVTEFVTNVGALTTTDYAKYYLSLLYFSLTRNKLTVFIYHQLQKFKK